MISLADRAANYQRTFPKWPAPRTDERWLDTVWVLGNDYQGSGYYGSYPPGYLKRVLSLFPEITPKSRVLHLFSGTLRAGPYIRLDLKNSPDVRGDAQYLPFRKESFDLIIADPPYSERHAVKYKVPYPNKRTVFEEIWMVLKTGGHLVWLDQVHPMYSKNDFHLWGLIGIVRSTNHAYRFTTLFTKI